MATTTRSTFSLWHQVFDSATKPNKPPCCFPPIARFQAAAISNPLLLNKPTIVAIADEERRHQFHQAQRVAGYAQRRCPRRNPPARHQRIAASCNGVPSEASHTGLRRAAAQYSGGRARVAAGRHRLHAASGAALLQVRANAAGRVGVTACRRHVHAHTRL